MNTEIVSRFLNRLHCHRCGVSLKGAEITFLVNSPVAGIAYIVCQRCGGETLATLSIAGSSATNIRTDLSPAEVGRFFGALSVSTDDLLDLHELIRKGVLWKALEQEKEKFSEKRLKSSAKGALFPPSSTGKASPRSLLS